MTAKLMPRRKTQAEYQALYKSLMETKLDKKNIVFLSDDLSHRTRQEILEETAYGHTFDQFLNKFQKFVLQTQAFRGYKIEPKESVFYVELLRRRAFNCYLNSKGVNGSLNLFNSLPRFGSLGVSLFGKPDASTLVRKNQVFVSPYVMFPIITKQSDMLADFSLFARQALVFPAKEPTLKHSIFGAELHANNSHFTLYQKTSGLWRSLGQSPTLAFRIRSPLPYLSRVHSDVKIASGKSQSVHVTGQFVFRHTALLMFGLPFVFYHQSALGFSNEEQFNYGVKQNFITFTENAPRCRTAIGSISSVGLINSIFKNLNIYVFLFGNICLTEKQKIWTQEWNWGLGNRLWQNQRGSGMLLLNFSRNEEQKRISLKFTFGD